MSARTRRLKWKEFLEPPEEVRRPDDTTTVHQQNEDDHQVPELSISDKIKLYIARTKLVWYMYHKLPFSF